MKISYNTNKLDALDLILEKNRKKLSKLLLKNSLNKIPVYKANGQKNHIVNKTKTKVNTILKAIGFRKTKSSLNILMNYILKNTQFLQNELGDKIDINNKDIEFERFDLIDDENNKKKFAKSLKEDSLQNRQILHLVFSLPNNNIENEDKLLYLVKEYLPNIFEGYKYVVGLHKNTSNMHIHIGLKCKNDITHKRLRIGGRELININKYLYNKCIEENIDLNSNIVIKEDNIKKDKKIIAKKLPDFIKKSVPNFYKMYESNNFKKLNANQSTLTALNSLGMKNSEDINKFLCMYYENPKLATYIINKMPKMFSLNKNIINKYKKVNNVDGFTLRKVKIIDKNKDLAR